MIVEFAWYESERRANLAKHGLDFGRVADLFAGLILAADDTRRAYAERRVLAKGVSAGRIVTCVYTDRTSADGKVTRRIISLRPASRRERQSYADHARPPS